MSPGAKNAPGIRSICAEQTPAVSTISIAAIVLEHMNVTTPVWVCVGTSRFAWSNVAFGRKRFTPSQHEQIRYQQ